MRLTVRSPSSEVDERLRSLAGLFAVKVAGFAVMSNHLHLVVRSFCSTKIELCWLMSGPAGHTVDEFFG